MAFILYFCIPVGLFIGGLAMLGTVGQPMVTTLESVGFFFGGVLFFALLGGYIYFLWRTRQPHRESVRKYNDMKETLSNRMGSGEYDYIYVDMKNYSAYCYRPDGSFRELSFREYGYRDVSDSGSLMYVLKDLERRLDGYLVTQHEDRGFYNPSVTVTHASMPKGSDGYYVSFSDADTVSMPTCAYLYLGEMARQKRREDKKKNSIFR